MCVTYLRSSTCDARPPMESRGDNLHNIAHSDYNSYCARCKAFAPANASTTSAYRYPSLHMLTKKKIVVGYNCLFVLTWILSLVYFIFYTKGWSNTAHARITSTMWMDESVYSKKPLKYCDNRDYDYFEYGTWNYSNIKCRTYSEQTVFTKGISPGNYWASTMFVERLHNIDGDTIVEGSRKIYYAKHVEDMKMGLQIGAEIPQLDYVSQVPTTSTPIYVKLPRSLKRKQIKEAYEALGLELQSSSKQLTHRYFFYFES